MLGTGGVFHPSGEHSPRDDTGNEGPGSPVDLQVDLQVDLRRNSPPWRQGWCARDPSCAPRAPHVPQQRRFALRFIVREAPRYTWCELLYL